MSERSNIFSLPKRALNRLTRDSQLLFARLEHKIRPEKACHIAICGFPRAGTSVLFNMLASTMKGFNNLGRETGALAVLNRRGNWITKQPNDIFHIGKIAAQNFRAKKVLVIALYRDPSDSITSVHRLLPDDYYMGYDKRGFDQCGLGEIYNAYKKAIDHPPAGVDFLTFSYEELCGAPSRLQAEITRRLQAEFSADMKDFYKSGGQMAYKSGERAEKIAAGPLVKERLGKWKKPERIRSQFTQFPELFAMVEELGYEKDRDWFDTYRT